MASISRKDMNIPWAFCQWSLFEIVRWPPPRGAETSPHVFLCFPWHLPCLAHLRVNCFDMHMLCSLFKKHTSDYISFLHLLLWKVRCKYGELLWDFTASETRKIKEKLLAMITELGCSTKGGNPMHHEIKRRLELTNTEEPIRSRVVTRVTGTLILPYEVHTTTIGTEVCTQFTLIDVCVETKNSIET